MNKIKWPILGIAILGIAAAYANKPVKIGPMDMHLYSYMYESQDGSRIYYGMDLTASGYVKGIDYDCVKPAYGCTFAGNPLLAQFDMTGFYFYTDDVPTSGIDDSGNFEFLDDSHRHGH